MEIKQLEELKSGIESKAVEAAEAKIVEAQAESKSAIDAMGVKLDEALESMEKAMSVEKETKSTGYNKDFVADKCMELLKSGHGAEFVSKDITLGDDVSLGYLAGHAYSNEIGAKMYKTSPMRDFATVMNIGANADIELPYETETSVALFASELESSQDTQPKVNILKLLPNRLVATVAMTDKIMQAGRVVIENYVRSTVSKGFSLAENRNFITGAANTANPTGILNSGITNNVDSATANEISFDDLFDLVAEIPQYLDKSFIMNSKTIATLRKIKGNDQYLWTAPAENTPGTIAGISYFVMEDMPDVATGSIPVICGDMSEYFIADSGAFTIIVDKFSRKREGVTELQFTKMVDGGVRQTDAFATLTIS